MPDTLEAQDVSHAVSLDPSNIYWSEWPDAQTIADAVREWGIAVFPGFLQGELLDALNEEFDELIAQQREGEGHFPGDAYGNIVNVRIRRGVIPDDMIPATRTLFSSQELQSVSTAYFYGNDYCLIGIFL